MGRTKPVLCFALFLWLTSCVSKANYDAVLQEKVTLEQSIADEQSARKNCAEENQTSSQRCSELEQQNQNLRNINQMLSKKNMLLADELTSAKGVTLETKKQLMDKEKAL